MKNQLLITIFFTIKTLSDAMLNTWVEGNYIIVTKEPIMNANYNAMESWNNIPNFNGFLSKLTRDQFNEAQNDPLIKYIELDKPVYALGDYCPNIQSGNQSWGQSRTTRVNGTGEYNHNKEWGSDVDLYVIDTGVNCEHEEFDNIKCSCGPTYSDGIDGCSDGNSHGTFCASIASGNIYGVSKSPNIIGVKVLGDSGMGSTAGVIAGMNYVAGQTGNRVASMSLGGGFSQASNDAANAMVESGVALAVAAGNENMDACYKSPASAELAITVGSMDINDKRSYFSNYGKCMDIYAPGSDITGASNNPGTYVTGSGTSMATPHVAAVLAKLRSDNPYMSPLMIKSKLLSSTLEDMIEDAKEESPNKLLHIEC